MGLQKTIISSTGIEVADAYIRVDEYSCDKNSNINARVRAYVSRELFYDGKSPIEGSDMTINIQGDYRVGAHNIKTQIYNSIKELEGYADAEDVFE